MVLSATAEFRSAAGMSGMLRKTGHIALQPDLTSSLMRSRECGESSVHKNVC